MPEWSYRSPRGRPVTSVYLPGHYLVEPVESRVAEYWQAVLPVWGSLPAEFQEQLELLSKVLAS